MPSPRKERPRRTYTAQQKAEALELYQTHGPRAASKETGVPVSTIQSWARRGGVHTVRNAKQFAQVEAAQIDAAKVRALVTTKTISVTETLIEKIANRINDEAETIPVKDLAVIFGIISDKHRALAAMDRNTENNNAVDAWLAHITGQTTP